MPEVLHHLGRQSEVRLLDLPSRGRSSPGGVGSDSNEARPPVTATNGKQMRVKGAAAEREVVRVLRAHGLPADRSYGAGRPDDRGDIDGIPWACVEVKAHRVLDLAGFMDEAISEAQDGQTPVVVAKRRGKPAEEWYAVVRLEDFATMVAALQAAVYG